MAALRRGSARLLSRCCAPAAPLTATTALPTPWAAPLPTAPSIRLGDQQFSEFLLGCRAFGSSVPARARHGKQEEEREAASGSMDFDSSVDPEETAKFGALAEEWWRPDGPFSMLHSMNPIRCRFIRQNLCAHFRLDPDVPEPLEGLTVADVGCGGGLLTESLARMGATVTGIDATERNIRIARLHAAADPLVAGRVQYEAATVEELVAAGRQFDAVMCLEVVEHVRNPDEFCAGLGDLTKMGGKLVMSTMNRTPLAYVVAIVGAEYITGLVPRGTHDWERFVTPEELTLMVEGGGLELAQMAGMTYNPLSGRWSLNDDLRVNYIASFVKGLQAEGVWRGGANPAPAAPADSLPAPA
mmetsp:Transcript_18085/g.45420  ORF Transcript_18085/g.45420 Transcript_18085/m.45420 type:complete len:357 (+) Transcript_18085:127-1197(+)